MDYFKEMQKVYDSEINFTIGHFWDEGVTLKIGDDMNGFKYESTELDYKSAIEKLIIKIIELYPDSTYAQEKIKIWNKHASGGIDLNKMTNAYIIKMLDGEIYK